MVKAGTLDAVAPSPQQDGTVALKDALYVGTATAGLQQAQYTITTVTPRPPSSRSSCRSGSR